MICSLELQFLFLCLKNCFASFSDWVRSVAWSPDNFQIVSGSADHTVRIWESMFGEIEQVLSTGEL